MTQRTLIVHTGGIGDFLCTLPALKTLSATCTIDIAGIPERIALAEAAGIASKTFDLERTGFHSVFTTPNDTLREFVEPYGRAFIWMSDGDGLIQQNLRAAGLNEVHCFPGFPESTWNRSAALWYGECLSLPIDLPAQLHFGPTTHLADIIIQPGSGSPRKNWPLEKFHELGEHLEALGFSVMWCRGPAEEDVGKLGRELPPMSLCDLARTLSGAKLFVGNDSGISHLASIAGCPSVAIFGPTDATVWHPVGKRTTVVQGNPWPDVDSVLRATMARVGA